MYVVKFIDRVEQTINASEYTRLWDALKVAKETNIGPDRLHTPAISDAAFNEHLLLLLTSGFIPIGPKTEEYPDGTMMVQLLKRYEDRETPVFATPIPLATNPISYTKDNSVTEMYTIMQYINPPVAEDKDGNNG